jgi:hypothetical protein
MYRTTVYTWIIALSAGVLILLLQNHGNAELQNRAPAMFIASPLSMPEPLRGLLGLNKRGVGRMIGQHPAGYAIGRHRMFLQPQGKATAPGLRSSKGTAAHEMCG